MAIMEELTEKVELYGPYGYIPKMVPAIIFAAVYGVCTVAHTTLGFKTGQKGSWLPTLAFGCLAETAAMGLRIYGHFYPDDDPLTGASNGSNAYIAQQCLSVLTPALFAAAHFTILGMTILTFGKQYALISPRLIVPFFVGVDLVSLITQAAGSGIAAIAEQADPPESTVTGAWIVVAGLFIQLFAYGVFNVVFIIFALRTRAEPPKHPLWNGRMRLFRLMAWISSLFVLLRSLFRVGEMLQGWLGGVATTEWYFYAFDATPVSLAVLILIPFHPGFFLPSGIKLFKKENNVPSIEDQVAEK